MAKFFCPKCSQLTYSLRYLFMTREKTEWRKPKNLPQYCESCDKIIPQVKCKTMEEMEVKK